MGVTPRPLDGGDECITDTGDGVSVPNEEELLRAMFGDPDERGVYGAPEEEGA